MKSQQIEQNEWQQFCESFSRAHHGWLVSVTVSGTGSDKAKIGSATTGPKTTLAQNLPLQEIREASHNGHVEIMITVGKDKDETSFLVEDVAALYEHTEAGKDLGLRIDSANAESTTVHFREPASPEQLNGLAGSEL